jgi:hypothetical protein
MRWHVGPNGLLTRSTLAPKHDHTPNGTRAPRLAAQREDAVMVVAIHRTPCGTIVEPVLPGANHGPAVLHIRSSPDGAPRIVPHRC